jgi:hypothetical protein
MTSSWILMILTRKERRRCSGPNPNPYQLRLGFRGRYEWTRTINMSLGDPGQYILTTVGNISTHGSLADSWWVSNIIYRAPAVYLSESWVFSSSN